MNNLGQQKLRGLYFPYSRCTNEQTIKRAILLFDEVLLMDPLPRGLRAELSGSPQSHGIAERTWETFEEDHQLLFENGVLKLHDPTQEVKKYDTLLTKAFEADNNDDEFWKACLSSSDAPPWRPVHPEHPEAWYILKERVPKSVFQLFRESWSPGYIFHAMAQADYALGGDSMFRGPLVWTHGVPGHVAPELAEGAKDDFIKASPKQIFDHIFRRIYSDQEVGLELDYRMYHGREATDEDKQNYVFSCLFSFAHGSSLALNQTLLSSELLGAAPFTDSEIHHRLLCVKYRRATSAVSSAQEAFPELSIALNHQDLARLSMLSFTVFRALLPDQLLSQLTVEQCYQYRAACEEHRRRFVDLMLELDATIKNVAWDRGIEREIKGLVYGKVVPEAQKLQDRMAEVRAKLFANIAFTTSTVALPSLLAAIAPGIGPMLVLLLGSSAVAGGALAVGIKEIKDALMESRNLRRNGLSYLMRLPKI